MYLRELSVSERRSTEPPIAHHSTLEITATVTTANADPTATVPFLRTHHRQPWHPQALKYLHGYHPQDTLLLNMVQLLVSDQDPSGAQEVTPEARIMQEDLIWVLDQPIVKEAAALVAVAEEEEEEVEDIEVFSMARTGLGQEQTPISEKRLALY